MKIGICGTLTLIFVVLKLIGIINWHWIWVLSPLWIGLVPIILLLILGTVISILIAYNEGKINK